jgi:hypothetical protein
MSPGLLSWLTGYTRQRIWQICQTPENTGGNDGEGRVEPTTAEAS